MAATDLRDSSTWASLAKPDPEYEEKHPEQGRNVDDFWRAMTDLLIQFAKAMPGGPPDIGMFPDIPSLIKFMTESTPRGDQVPPPAGVKEDDRKISMRGGHKITVRIHSPEKAPPGGSPLDVIYHGGGWCIGDLSAEQNLIRRMVTDFGMTVVNVDYRMGPDWKFPTAINDCYDATKWAAANSSALGADPSKGFIIGGTSAGGNMTAVVSHLWRDDNITPKITGCHLMIPAVCNAIAVPEKYQKEFQSWDQLEFAHILSRKACDLFMDNYIPNVKDSADPLMNPLLWKTGHKDLPPQYFQICGADPLRDEALIYERLLREECGVRTKVEIYPGVPHGF